MLRCRHRGGSQAADEQPAGLLHACSTCTLLAWHDGQARWPIPCTGLRTFFLELISTTSTYLAEDQNQNQRKTRLREGLGGGRRPGAVAACWLTLVRGRKRTPGFPVDITEDWRKTRRVRVATRSDKTGERAHEKVCLRSRSGKISGRDLSSHLCMASETDVAGGNGTVPSCVLDAGGVQHAVAILGSINI